CRAHAARSFAELDALRIDVDDGGQAGAAHRRRGGTEETSRLRRQPPRLLRLRNELRPVLASEPKEWSGPQQIAWKARLELCERPQRGLRLGPGHDDADEVAERRVAELTPPLELACQEARDVVARGELDRP